ncbi:flagellar transcriptional regulator FlhC [Ramlibacter sp. AW1]|uniref:Flagellar transcriptional regulator FlhC n=1 Tax=Ramlibacter aurantiacus TaxID=2801330 RepID=A0A936ZQ75_9BURK|nr:flagellar transcriptional regulator FlhC [Ramlibacter aurantiacus]MBL0421443.1 flagellar transcriptional regulator FlhC [Ramlibacter aurantiacus]
MASNRSLLTENHQFNQAVELIRLGARMAVLQSETELSYERLVRLYREVTGQSPSKGQLPYSTDWFIGWQPNIHASLFLNIRERLSRGCSLDRIELLVKSWRLYECEVQAMGVEPMLSITRAWRLVKFVDNDMLALTRCSACGGRFVTHPHDWTHREFVCGLCEPPARAGKSQRSGTIH